MEIVQNTKAAHSTLIKETFYYQESQEGFLDLEDILYPQRKEYNQSSTCKIQQNISIQVTHQIPIISQDRIISPQHPKEIVQLHDNITQTKYLWDNQTKMQSKVLRSRQSNKHNFPKHLVRKIKDLMKKILSIKKKAKLQGTVSLRNLFFYYFHQSLRKYENIHILHLFLQHQDQTTSLQKEFKTQTQQHGMYQDITLQLINNLRLQLRKAIIQQQKRSNRQKRRIYRVYKIISARHQVRNCEINSQMKRLIESIQLS